MNASGISNLSGDCLENMLLTLWRRALNNQQVTVDDDFFECGGDSLLASRVLLEIEQCTGEKISTSLIFETGTIRELLKRLGQEAQKHDLPGPENGHIIHLFHGDFRSGGVPVMSFVNMLGSDHRIHAIQPHIPRDDDPLISIEDMARQRLPDIIEIQPDGPYILAGHCNGSVVGFEAARLLAAMGKEVKAVVMIDPLIVSVRKSAQLLLKAHDFIMRLMNVPENRRYMRLLETWKKMYRFDSITKDKWRLAYLVRVCKKIAEISTRMIDRPHPVRCLPHRIPMNVLSPVKAGQGGHEERPPAVVENLETMDSRMLYFLKVLFDYTPAALDVPVLYISLEYSGYAWRRISRNTEFFNICRGAHHFWEKEYAPLIFKKIREFINR